MRLASALRHRTCKRGANEGENTPFQPHTKAAAEVNDLYRRELAPPSVGPMASWAGGEHLDEWYIPDADLRTKFCDALIDVSRFIEEIRFEIAYGALLIWDWDERLADGDAAEPDSTSSAVPFPIEALTLITSYMRAPPPPTELFNAPYQKLSGERV